MRVRSMFLELAEYAQILTNMEIGTEADTDADTDRDVHVDSDTKADTRTQIQARRQRPRQRQMICKYICAEHLQPCVHTYDMCKHVFCTAHTVRMQGSTTPPNL